MPPVSDSLPHLPHVIAFGVELTFLPGGIGQPLSLLLKENPNVTELALYDVRNAPGVAADISHVNTNSTVKGYEADA